MIKLEKKAEQNGDGIIIEKSGKKYTCTMIQWKKSTENRERERIKHNDVTVIFGVGFRGESGPKAPIVDGTNIRRLYCLASSITL